MKRIVICLTNDILFDRRMLRTIEVLSLQYKIEVLCRKIHSEHVDIHNVNVQRLSCLFKSGFLFYFEYNLRLFFKLLFLRFDIVLAVDYDTIMPSAIIRILKRKLLVFDAHEYFEESVEIVDRKRVQGMWKWIGRSFVKRADAAYTVSQTIAAEYEQIHSIHFSVIRNVPLLAKENFSIVKDNKIILYQGVLNQGRKLEMLIEAANLLDDAYQFWIVGEGDISDHLKAVAGENVKFLSWVNPEKLSDITKKATLGYNLLDTSSKSYYYSLANKFFDYMHAGVPSINNVYPEYAKINERYNCCFTVNIEQPSELASFIKAKLEEIGDMKEKIKNAQIASRDLCWEKESERLLEIYKNL